MNRSFVKSFVFLFLSVSGLASAHHHDGLVGAGNNLSGALYRFQGTIIGFDVPQRPFFTSLNEATRHAIQDLQVTLSSATQGAPEDVVHDLCDHLVGSLNGWEQVYAQGEYKLSVDRHPEYQAVYQAGLYVHPAVQQVRQECSDQ